MLKRYLLSKLTSVFGKYVDGLDDESLQVGVWSGKIELADVKLRKEAIDKLRLPLLVIQGSTDPFGTLERARLIGERAGQCVTILELAESGHNPHVEAESAILKAVVDFLREAEECSGDRTEHKYKSR